MSGINAIGRPSYDLLGSGFVVEETVQASIPGSDEPVQKKRFRCGFDCGVTYAPMQGGRVPSTKFIHHLVTKCSKISEEKKEQLNSITKGASGRVEISSNFQAALVKQPTQEQQDRHGNAWFVPCALLSHHSAAASAMDSSLKESLSRGEKAFGAFLLSASTVVAEVLAYAGMDFVVVDMEHSPISTSDLPSLLVAVQSTGAAALVRVPSNDEVAIKKVLDLGPSGIIVPLVNTAEEAQAAARACRYPPIGTRGVAYPLVRASRYGMDPSYLETCESKTLVLVQAESKEAVDNLPGILKVEGVDGIFVGPLDLSASVGRIGAVDCDEVTRLLRRVESLVPKAGKVLAGFQSGARSASDLFSAGYTMVAGAVDIGLIREGAKAAIEKSKSQGDGDVGI